MCIFFLSPLPGRSIKHTALLSYLLLPPFLPYSNNTARTESPKDARVIDRRIKAAWAQHPHLVVIGNETDFAGKLDKATEAVLTGGRNFFGAGNGGATVGVTGEGKGEGEGGGKGREGRLK